VGTVEDGITRRQLLIGGGASVALLAAAGVDRLGGLPVRVDCGKQDPFYEADKAFAEALPEEPQGGFDPGGHSDAYRRRGAPPEMDFIAAALSGARGS
jgi:hypothetical protein